jgi:hypothetical protein
MVQVDCSVCANLAEEVLQCGQLCVLQGLSHGLQRVPHGMGQALAARVVNLQPGVAQPLVGEVQASPLHLFPFDRAGF